LRWLDVRLIEYRTAAVARQGTTSIQTKAVAAELGSSQEVISRLPKDFDKAGLVTLARGSVWRFRHLPGQLAGFYTMLDDIPQVTAGLV
jgi:hypothetical protein